MAVLPDQETPLSWEIIFSWTTAISLTVSDIEIGKPFNLSNGKSFIKGVKLRKRFRCVEQQTNKVYLFHPFTEVIQLGNSYVLLKINEVRINKVKIDKEKELEKLIQIETNKQLNQFSRIYFDKSKMNYSINEK